MRDLVSDGEDLPDFDPTATCTKCGNSLPTAQEIEAEQEANQQMEMQRKADELQMRESLKTRTSNKPEAKPSTAATDTRANPKGSHNPNKPKPSTRASAPVPTVRYCNGEDCPWDEEHNGMDEHLHQWCDVCGYEWLSKPLDASTTKKGIGTPSKLGSTTGGTGADTTV